MKLETYRKRAQKLAQKNKLLDDFNFCDVTLKLYMKEGELSAEIISRGVAWLDTGTPKALLEASAYIAAIEERQGLKVACPEEIALRMNFISKEKFNNTVDDLPNCAYKKYLQDIGHEI
jgi:glucose-1-phosphate thymidylyltransferase